MKAFILAGISALALGASTTAAGVAPGAPRSIESAASDFTIIPLEQISASAPKPPVVPDAAAYKTYIADYLDWIFTPGHLVERSVLFQNGQPPGIPQDVDFTATVAELAESGHAAATLINSEDAEAPKRLVESGNATARLITELDNLSIGSIQQKVDALAWFPAEAPKNRDAASGLGSFLLTQGGGGDF